VNDNERFFFESGYHQAKQDIMKELGIHNVILIDYLKATIEQAVAWNLLDEVIDHSVSLRVAANKLQREIEKARGV